MEDFEPKRRRMVEAQLERRGITDQRVLDVMRTVPRHEFVSRQQWNHAYDDGPLSIGQGQTISQPYVVAAMTQALGLEESHRVLEIGTGCGYQTVVLAELVSEVFSIEYLPELHRLAEKTLARLSYRNVHLRCGDGAYGWPEEAPFDGIIVTAASPRIPDALVSQLKMGGRMVVPLGSSYADAQELIRIERTERGLVRDRLFDVRFVPMRGKVESD